MTPRLPALVLLLASVGCGGAEPSPPTGSGPGGPAHAGDESPPPLDSGPPDAGAPTDAGEPTDEALLRMLDTTREEVVEVERRVDTDHDGLLDGADLCPGDPEDLDGDRDEDGCPEASVSDAPVAPKGR